MKKAYIAGPMRGYVDCNFQAFDVAESELRRLGYEPISPAAIDRLLEGWKFGPAESEFLSGDLKRFIRRDLLILLDMDAQTDAIYLLCGWQDSKGARVEKALAEFMGLRIIYQEGADEA